MNGSPDYFEKENELDDAKVEGQEKRKEKILLWYTTGRGGG